MAPKRIIYAMGRRRRNVIITLCVLAASLVVWIDRRLEITPRWLTEAPRAAAASDFEKYHEKSFTVMKVVDGDTLDLDVPDDGQAKTRIRLLGIDTPESVRPGSSVMYFGPEACRFAKSLSLNKKVQVLLDTISPTRDKFNRLLAYLRLPDGSVINEVLLREGYAYADLRFRHGCYNKYSHLAAAAQREGKGLWKNVRRDQLPQWLQRKRPTLLDRRL